MPTSVGLRVMESITVVVIAGTNPTGSIIAVRTVDSKVMASITALARMQVIRPAQRSLTTLANSFAATNRMVNITAVPTAVIRVTGTITVEATAVTKATGNIIAQVTSRQQDAPNQRLQNDRQTAMRFGSLALAWLQIAVNDR